TTISKILKDKSKWLAVIEDQLSSTVFQHKQVKYPLLDQSMRLWVEQITNSEVILMELIIKEKVALFANALDEETSNNSELESANNSRNNRDNHGKHSTSRSKGHYDSGYG
ncbi:10768_t:CDS:2, partial [Dentiscutata heterogama]